jgi:hypothetical protein
MLLCSSWKSPGDPFLLVVFWRSAVSRRGRRALILFVAVQILCLAEVAVFYWFSPAREPAMVLFGVHFGSIEITLFGWMIWESIKELEERTRRGIEAKFHKPH